MNEVWGDRVEAGPRGGAGRLDEFSLNILNSFYCLKFIQVLFHAKESAMRQQDVSYREL